MNLSNRIKSCFNWLLLGAAACSGIGAQPIERADNWPYSQHSQDSSYISQNLPGVNFDFSETDSTNEISAEIIEGRDISRLGFIVLSEDQQRQFSNECWVECSGIQDTLTVTSSPFVYLPDTARVSVIAKDFNGRTFFLDDTLYTHENERTVMIDRNGKSETLYMIEGSGPYTLGWIVDSVRVSTGLRTDSTETPLGFFHVIAKKDSQYSHQYNCSILSASWITTWQHNFDIGIHEGYPGTDYGRPASHGCIRVPKEFIDYFHNWIRVGDNVAIIGRSYGGEALRGHFNTNLYSLFKNIVLALRQFRRDAIECNVGYGYYAPNDQKTIQRIYNFYNAIEEGCENWAPVDFQEDVMKFFMDCIIGSSYDQDPEDFLMR